MFIKARVKLTAWYLLTITLISGVFSFVIYRGVSLEFEQRFHHIERRLQIQRDHRSPRMRGSGLLLFEEDLATAKSRVLLMLLLANGVILVLAGAGGYFLAGKTLKPIERALDEQKRFVADASHELRTPLTALKTSIEVALREKESDPDEVKKTLESVLEEVDDLAALTSSLLTLARHQKSSAAEKLAPLNLKDVVESACAEVAPLAKKKNIALGLRADEVIVKGDLLSLKKMTVALLDNAIKYTPPEGEVDLILRMDKRGAHLQVKDTGVGIPETDIARIFDRFYRVDVARSEVSGFGLGLSLVKAIVDLHKGTIHVSSTPNSGSTFTVKLPLERS